MPTYRYVMSKKKGKKKKKGERKKGKQKRKEGMKKTARSPT